MDGWTQVGETERALYINQRLNESRQVMKDKCIVTNSFVSLCSFASQVFLFPLRTYLDLDISFSGEEADRYMQKAIVMFLSAVDTLKGLFFVKNLFESLKVSECVFVSVPCDPPPHHHMMLLIT